MNVQTAIDNLRQNSDAIRLLVHDTDDATARRKPDAASWSVLEVVNHLYDEEREDFRAHLDQILHRPDEAWLRIDPEGWVTERGYNGRNLSESLANFLQERQRSLEWLAALPEPDWTATRPAPWGEVSAGDMLAAWVAHDILHLRQLVELKWANTLDVLRPFQVRYAGEW
ncbi:MAG: DinB family protein [Ardenticatenaceae bacterium]|nr:DinB family protein [Ardenticatenaceae bacterium]MCB8988706.1 DinB family protein [Ardenticatenaceae bacterium]